jgi:lipoyl(octanoyl) transferase
MSQKSNHNIEWRNSKDLVHFEDALKFMQERVEQIISGNSKELIWTLEHYPVYTAGVSAKDEDLLVKTDIPVFKTNRGGKYTYHGPKMKIIYIMLDLKKFFAPNPPDIAKFVEFLENWVIAILAEFGVKGEIKKGRVGIWVETKEGEKKIGAIGIKVKKWVTYHGIAINISPDLRAFENIVPCGIKEFGVTSLQKLGVNLDREFDDLVKEKFFAVLKNI